MKNFMEILLEKSCFCKTDGTERLYSYSEIEKAFEEFSSQLEPPVSLPSRTFGEWVDAEKETPKETGSYLCFLGEKGFWDIHNYSRGWWVKESSIWFDQGKPLENVKYWMALPPLPKP